MDYKRANRVFLYMILASLIFSLGYGAVYSLYGWEMNVLLNNFFSEVVVLIPAVIAILVSREPFREVIPFKKIKVSSGLLSAVYGALLMPVTTFIAMATMMVVKNHIEGMSDEILSMPMWQMLFSIGIFGPFVEEILFRGVFLNSYKRSGRTLAAILLSSLLFGIVHMNFNQFAYGVVMGIMFALVFEATGSVLAPFIAHGAFNSIEVLAMYIPTAISGEAREAVTRLDINSSNLAALGVSFVGAAVCTVLAICLVYKIASIEGRTGEFEGILKKKGEGKLVSFPLLAGIAIAAGFMVAIEVMSRISGT